MSSSTMPAAADRQLRQRVAERRVAALEHAEAAGDLAAVELQRGRLVGPRRPSQSLVVLLSLSAGTKPPRMHW